MTSATYRYEIDDNDNFTISCWQDDIPDPFLLQPHWPNGELFASHAEAEQWITEKLEEIEDPTAPYATDGPGLSRFPRPTAEELAVSKLRQVGLTVEDLKALLGL